MLNSNSFHLDKILQLHRWYYRIWEEGGEGKNLHFKALLNLLKILSFLDETLPSSQADSPNSSLSNTNYILDNNNYNDKNPTMLVSIGHLMNKSDFSNNADIWHTQTVSVDVNYNDYLKNYCDSVDLRVYFKTKRSLYLGTE